MRNLEGRLERVERAVAQQGDRKPCGPWTIIVSGSSKEEVDKKVKEEIERRKSMGIPENAPGAPDIVAIYCSDYCSERANQREDG